MCDGVGDGGGRCGDGVHEYDDDEDDDDDADDDDDDVEVYLGVHVCTCSDIVGTIRRPMSTLTTCVSSHEFQTDGCNGAVAMGCSRIPWDTPLTGNG